MTEVNRIPMGQKIAFGIGMLANQMFPAALSIFMVILRSEEHTSELQSPS